MGILLRIFSLFIVVFPCNSGFAEPKMLTLALPLEDVSGIEIYGKRFTEFYEKVFDPAGYKIKFVYLPTKRSLMVSDAGVIDGEAARIAGLRKHGMVHNLFRISPAISWVETHIFGHEKAKHHSNWEEVAKTEVDVGIQRGMVIWASRARKHGVRVLELNSISQGIELLNLGRISYFVAPGGIGRKWCSPTNPTAPFYLKALWVKTMFIFGSIKNICL